ncbi:hypothetical protein TNCV_4472251 [Trichonephila clavipes]|uniref:Uncharacterized protein n=1 Tax=Trichonephila clavipes TaxID=2585209 RepID=A0A8X6VFY2_TRICX|nr:hypothetical protein TNCV_4472251 [Trichonephila clavipes]
MKLFTDESRIGLQHHDGRIRVWRDRGERILNSCVMHRHTGLAPGIMVWGDGLMSVKFVESSHLSPHVGVILKFEDWVIPAQISLTLDYKICRQYPLPSLKVLANRILHHVIRAKSSRKNILVNSMSCLDLRIQLNQVKSVAPSGNPNVSNLAITSQCTGIAGLVG